MLCRKCSAEIPDNSLFCNICGIKQQKPAHSVKKRGNGQGTVFKIGDKWACEITLGYVKEDNTLKRRARRKKGFKTKKDAVMYLESLRNAPEKPKTVTISELWDIFKKSVDLSNSKLTAYNIAYKRIKSEIEYRTIDSFSVSELQDLTDENAPSYYTRRDIKNLLSHFYKLAIRDDYVDKNRAQFIKLPKLEASEREVFTDDEINMLWKDFKKPSIITAGILTMLYTGIRAGELLTIQSENVHLDEHYMTGGIKTEKGKARKIIIPDKLLPVIRYLLSQDNDKLSCYSYKSAFYDDWNAKRADLNLREALTPYCCRHTYITRLTALKVSPAMLQELAGHEDYETTLSYTHLSVSDRLKEVNRLK